MASLSKSRRLFIHLNRNVDVPKPLFYSTTPTPTPTPPFPSFRAAKAAIISESNPDKLAEILQKSIHFPTFQRHRPIYHLSIRKLARANRPDLIHRVLQSHPTPTSEGFFIRLIMLYSSAAMLDHAINTLELIKSSSQLSEKSLCAILTAHLNNRLFDQVRALFQTLPSKLNVTPGIASNNLVLKSFVEENNDVVAALNWVEIMEKDNKVLPNIDSYNLLLKGFLKNNDLVGFDGVVKEVLNKGISRLCKSKECARAKKLLDDMVSKGVKPNSASYDTIIDGFCRVGDLESAKKVLESMLSDGYVSPCSFPYYVLIRNAVKEGEFDLALEMCKETIRRRWIPPFEAMEGLVNGLVKMSRMEEAKEIVEKMKKRLKGSAVDSWGKIEAALPL
ncbi:hypothetical protein ACB098_03G098100 [Castanea mollissima]